MYYEVYIDRLLLINFFMNLFCLELTNLTFLKCASRKRVIIGAVLGAVFYLIPFLLPGTAYIKMFFGFSLSAIAMILVTFRTRKLSAFWSAMQRLFLCSFLMGGFLLFLIRSLPGLRERLTSVLGLLGIGTLFYMEITFLVEKSGSASKIYYVELIGNGVKVGTHALFDTGNGLVEPISGKPVCIVEKSVLEKMWKDGDPPGYRAIPYHSVGKKNGILSGYRIPELKIEIDGLIRERKEVYVGVSDEKLSRGGDYEMILNPMVLKEE